MTLRTLAIFAALLVSIGLLSACDTQQEARARDILNTSEYGGNLKTAERMLRLDDFREFEQAEVHFLMLRLKDRDDVHTAGWLAQLYVAWTEQLRSEIDLLRLKLIAAELADQQSERMNVLQLLDLRTNQLGEVTESARLLGGVIVRYNPDTYIGHRVMADYYRVMGDREAMQKEIEEVKKLNPDSVGLLFIQGAALAGFDHDYKGAIQLYNQALEKDPMFIKALYFKGLAQEQRGEKDAAALTMQQVLEKSPKHPGATAYVALNQYIDSLGEEARLEFAEMTKNQVDRTTLTDVPRLVFWVGEWINGQPRLRYRLSGLPYGRADVRLDISLIEGDQRVVDTKEEKIHLLPGGFTSGTASFAGIKIDPKEYYSILVRVMAKTPEEQSYQTVEAHRTQLINPTDLMLK